MNDNTTATHTPPDWTVIGTRECPHCGRALDVRRIDVAGRTIESVETCPDCEAERDLRATRLAVQCRIQETRDRCGAHYASIYASAGFARYRIEDRNRRAFEASRALVDSMVDRSLGGPRLLLLYGPAAAGKTLLAYAALNTAMRRGVRGAVVRAVSLVEAYADERFRRWLLAWPRLLLIDDAGKEDLGGYLREDYQAALFEIVDRYYAAPGRGLIVTTELPLGRLLARYPDIRDALRWRMREMSAGGAAIRIGGRP